MATSKSTSAKKPVATKPATKKTTATTSKVAAKTPTARKPATTVKKPAPTPSKPAAPAKAAPGKAPAAPTGEQRYRMIQDAAYFIAEKNGFAGSSMDYWIAAEAEINVMLSGKGKK